MTALALKSFLTLLFVIDPVGLVPVFLSLAGARPGAEQRRIARKAVLVAAVLVAAFAVAGAWLLRHLAISMDAFRVAGGILLFLIAVDMVLAQHERETEAEAREARSRQDISVFPLAIPMISGPGTLASVMILSAEARGVEYGLAVVLATAALVLLSAFVALHLASPIGRLLGQTGVNVVTRVLGVLLAALAVQYVADGVKGLLA
ncbi:MAG TPA: MarC family protein [Vicinamibacteria bacterium]|nr:MarC family protein [Vicinamibacteria bacterium]